MRRRNEEQDLSERWSRNNFSDRSRNYINRGREMIDRGMNKLGRRMGSDYGRPEQFRSNEGREDRGTLPNDFERYGRGQNRSEMSPQEDIGYNADYSAVGGFDSSERFEREEPSRTFERSGFFGKGPKGWKRSPERIKEDVCEALWRNPRVDATDIDVSIENDSCVCLRGTVDGREAKREAEYCVENLSGVEDVRNELRVRRESNLGDVGKTANLS